MYQVQYCIPYEGWQIEHFSTLSEVMNWIEVYERMSYKPWDSYQVYRVEEVDVQSW